ncbi:hypothetical protein EJ03DRAFT_354342 [Teratosphaeria nubilosa]|uniref:BTB domain-containing protein n=1 Tax=Teratosphaeria nubilosa TaxID=161662 RepID=A0A6G1KZG0_9PEZI|nr:hypothetical protein EJ03DRAFT_354342 [Teratosphaeria nubilosa]
MAEGALWQLDKEYYSISQERALILRLTECRLVEGESKPHKVHEFRVKRSALIETAHFETLLCNPAFKEHEQTVVDLKDDHPVALATWLKTLHGSGEADATGDADITIEDITIENVWHVLAMANQYGFDPKMPAAKAWFDRWLLLFPTHSFNHARGFRLATKFVVYNANYYATERCPDAFFDTNMHLRQNVIQQINAARTRLKSILHRELYRPIKDLLEVAKCDDKEKALYAYEKALRTLPRGQLRSHSSTTASTLCFWLQSVKPFQLQTCGSRYCTINVTAAVAGAIKKCLE